MSALQIHTLETAPQESKPFLENAIKDYGQIPNLMGALAGSPRLIEAYQTLHGLFSNSSFDKDELTVVWQSINVENSCHYCVPAHTAIAHGMKVDKAITEALRNEIELPNEKLEVLRETTLAIVRNRGYISKEKIKAFYAVGYDERQLLEIILGLSQKVISNYVNHIAETPLDEVFKPFAWKK